MSHPKDRDLALWAGGDLPPGEAARVEDHLAECPACRALAEGLRASRQGVEALAAEPLDETALARVRAGVRRRLADEGGVGWASAHRRAGWTQPAGGRWAKAHPTVRALAAALVAAALGLGIWYLAGRPEPADELARAERPEREPRIAAREPRSVRPAPNVREPAATPGPAPPIAPPSVPPPKPPEQRAALAPAPAGPTESMVIKVVSDDPDIVYYWLVEPEETEHEPVTS